MSNNKAYEQKILDEIKKTGFPLEIYLTDILEKDNWTIYNQRQYLDPDENKYRSIDLLAHKIVDTPSSPIYKSLSITLIIECKKSDKPWVFYTRIKNKTRPFSVSIDNYNLVKDVSKPKLDTSNKQQYSKYFHYNTQENVSVLYIEPFKKEGYSQIFDAVNKVIKCLLYERKRLSSQYASSNFSSLLILYPIIVFDGNLYSLYNKQEIQPIQQIEYYIPHKSLTIDESFIIDIVSASFIETFIKSINTELNCIKEEIEYIKVGDK